MTRVQQPHVFQYHFPSLLAGAATDEGTLALASRQVPPLWNRRSSADGTFRSAIRWKAISASIGNKSSRTEVRNFHRPTNQHDSLFHLLMAYSSS
jgi:hypothetical protein